MSRWSWCLLTLIVSSCVMLYVAAWRYEHASRRLEAERQWLRRVGEDYCRVLMERGLAVWDEGD